MINAISAILFFSSIVLSGNTFGQLVVYDIPLDSVKQSILENPEYLVQLNKKTVHADSTVTIREYFNLYYGSAYLKGYSPYSERSIAKIPYELLQQEKYTEAIAICKNQILSNPGFIRPFYYLGIAYDRLGDTLTAQRFFDRFYDYLRIPFYSGTGISTDSAIVVRSVDDEYLIVGELFENDIPYDILYLVSQNDTIPTKMYFNISQPFLLGLGLNKKEKKTKKQGKTNATINNK